MKPGLSPVLPVLTLAMGLMLLDARAFAAQPEGPNRSAALPYYNRANRYLSQGRFEDAERDLLEAIHLYPDGFSHQPRSRLSQAR